MRTFPVLITLLAWLSTPISAYGIRGAAERAIYFIAYLQEEAYGNDASRMKVATNCVGTRVGLGGQAGRCHLSEFVDHIWRQTNTDVRPANVIWPPQATNVNALDAEKITRMINQHLKVPNPAGSGRPRPLRGGGYTGKVEMGNLLPNSASDTYWTALEKFGQIMKDARTFADSLPESTDDEKALKKKFSDWGTQGQNALKVAVDLRLRDKWDALNDPNKGNLRGKLGFDYETTPRTSPWGIVDSGWKELSAEATIQKLMNDNSWTREVAETRFNTQWATVTSSTIFIEHEAALTSTRKSLADSC